MCYKIWIIKSVFIYSHICHAIWRNAWIREHCFKKYIYKDVSFLKSRPLGCRFYHQPVEDAICVDRSTFIPVMMLWVSSIEFWTSNDSLKNYFCIYRYIRINVKYLSAYKIRLKDYNHYGRILDIILDINGDNVFKAWNIKLQSCTVWIIFREVKWIINIFNRKWKSFKHLYNAP